MGKRPAAAEPTEPAAWQGALSAAELVEIRVALLLRQQVAQANERRTKPHTAERTLAAARTTALAALLARLAQPGEPDGNGESVQ